MMIYVGDAYWGDLLQGPIPPVGARVWAGEWCTVTRVDYYASRPHIPGHMGRMGVEVYLTPMGPAS